MINEEPFVNFAKIGSAEEERRKETREEFTRRLAHAINFLTKRSPNLAAISESLWGWAKATISRWGRGNPVGFIRPRGADAMAGIVGLLLQKNYGYERTDKFLSAYCRFFECHCKSKSELYDDPLKSVIPTDNEHYRARIAIALILLTRAERHEQAFGLGNAYWHRITGEIDVAWYWTRESLSVARLGLSEEARDRAVGEAGHAIGLDDGRRLKGFEREARPVLFDPSSFPIIQGQLWELIEEGDSPKRCFAHCPGLDAALRSPSGLTLPLHREEKPYQLREDWQEFCWLALKEAFEKPGDLFEANKVRFVDGSLGAFVGEGRCRIQRATFFEHVVTGNSIESKFTNRKSGSQVSIDINPSLADSAEELPNHIGIGSLALTRDLKLVALHQTRKNWEPSEGIVPFGGSIEYEDLEQELASQPATMEGLLLGALGREISEECGVEPRSARHAILGYVVNLSCLKPDFLGVSALGIDWAELESHRELVYGGRPRACEISLESEDEFIDSIDEAERQWAPIRGKFLLANLRLLRSSYSIVKAMAY